MGSLSSFDSYVLVLGDASVGKEALARQYLEQVPPTDQLAEIRVWRKIDSIGRNLCSIQVISLSLASDFRFRAGQVEGSLVVFDLTSRKTFANTVDVWLDKISRHAKAGFVKVLVGNKCDLTDQRQVSREEAEQLAASHGMKYFETTATDYESTCGPFQCVLPKIFQARKGMTGLHRAASAGDVQAMHQLVADSPDQIDVRDDDGCSVFHYAAKNGHVNVIEGLVQRGSLLIDAPDKKGWAPMHIAAYFQQGEVIETLVRLGSKAIDTPDNWRSRPLYVAAMNCHVDVIELLIQLGSKAIDTPNIHGWTPMFAAASNGQVSVIETLVRLGSKAIDTPDNEGWTPMYRAALKGYVDVIETLVRLGSKAIDIPNNVSCTPMHAAATNGDVLTIETLVRLGSEVIDSDNNDGWTPLFAAANRGSVSAIEALVRLGSKAIDTPDNDGQTPVYIAALKGYVDVIEALVRLGSTAIDTINRGVIRRLASAQARTTLLALSCDPNQLDPMDEKDVIGVRYRVYFAETLVLRLLFDLDKPTESHLIQEPSLEIPNESDESQSRDDDLDRLESSGETVLSNQDESKKKCMIQ